MIGTNSITLDTKKLIIFDADWTLRYCTVPGQPCPNQDGEWGIYPQVLEWFHGSRPNVNYAIASNQLGVSKGYVSWGIAFRLLEELALTLNIPTEHMVMATKDDFYRKPWPGMLFRIMSHLQYTCPETLMVGDNDTDLQAAHNAGVDFCRADEFFGHSMGVPDNG